MVSELRKDLMECGAVMRGDFKLASGRRSQYYIDIKRASTDPVILSLMAREMSKLIRREALSPDRIGGVVLGSIPLAVALSLETGIPFVMVRRERKDHGVGRSIEGILEQGEEVVVVEDVITSASSVAEAVSSLREAGAEVNTALTVIDRQEGGAELLKGMGVRLLSLLTAADLLED